MTYKVATAYPNLSCCSHFDQFSSSLADFKAFWTMSCMHCWGSMTVCAFQLLSFRSHLFLFCSLCFVSYSFSFPFHASDSSPWLLKGNLGVFKLWISKLYLWQLRFSSRVEFVFLIKLLCNPEASVFPWD